MTLDDATLRAAWRDRAPRGADCAETERIWAAVRRELPAGERRALVRHAAGCPECAEAWRAAVALAPSPAAPASRRFQSGPAAGWAVAAIFVISVGLVVWFAGSFRDGRMVPGTVPGAVQDGAVDDAWRDVAPTAVESLLEEEAALPRGAFLLRWTPGPEGTVYDVEVGTPDLELLDRAYALAEAEYRIPPERLDAVEDGGRIAWRVVATAPNGRRATSPTFFNRVR